MSYFTELIAARQADLPHEKVSAIGIDLGTTNSSVAEASWDPKDPHTIQVRCLDIPQQTLNAGDTTSPLFPSVVVILGDRVLVGEGAKRLRARSTEHGLLPYKNLFYECKNEMGIKRTYNRAPEGYRCARDIAAIVLGCLVDTLERETTVRRAVVTVPASFQVPQRSDTVEAAREAGIELMPGDLLDEPLAAFLAFLNSVPDDDRLLRLGSSRLVVFDFGGGTCDIAVVQLTRQSSGHSITVAPLAVSRYYRLGGGDIDNAIVHQVLIPALLESNDVDPGQIEFKERKHLLEPALLGLAESLKISICNSVRSLKEFGRFDPTETQRHTAAPASSHACQVNNQKLTLASPTLTLEQFENVLEPFLDVDLTAPREGDYGITCSIFGPLEDALMRAGISKSEVDTLLLVGGSSLIPQVSEALQRYLGPGAKVRTFAEPEQVQTAIAEGAALNSLALRLFGEGLVRPVLSDSIVVRTSEGGVTLAPKGSSVPYPSDESWGQIDNLTIPEDGDSLDLRLDLMADDGHVARRLQSVIWNITGPVRRGQPLTLEYRIDSNQVLELRAFRSSSPDEPFHLTLERPLTHVVDPNETRGKIIDLEEKIRTGEYNGQARVGAFIELGKLCAEVGQYEKAISLLKSANTQAGAPHAQALHLAGIYAGNLKDFELEEKLYLAAAEADGRWSAPLFNLAHSRETRGKLQKARQALDLALEREREGAYLVLLARILRRQGDSEGSDAALAEAFQLFGPLEALEDYEISWMKSATRMAGDNALLAACDAESRRRRLGEGAAPVGGVLPAGPAEGD